MRRGFTFTELAIISVILSILVGMGVFSLLRTLKIEKLNTYTYMVFHDIEKARNAALKSLRAVFNCTSPHSYEIREFLGNGNAVVILRNQLPPDVTLMCNVAGNNVIFYPNGLPDRAGSLIISYSGDNRRIIINNINGEMRVE